ncbi:MAG TPA: nicotinamidase [Vicinamibacterales bacterium]|nr:nicotinamidase [Vicinamibacterales bacterium]
MKAALIVVDVQRDFCPGGALAAPGGDAILPAINRYIADAARLGMPVFATRDWHPRVTSHFKAYGGEWPPHCVQNTSGAAFHPGLKLPSDTIVISKGMDDDQPGYSAFDGNTKDGQALIAQLQDRHIERLFVTGIATDYCVLKTVLDARRAGLGVTVLDDAVTGIDVNPGDVDRAMKEMQAAGANVGQKIT